MKKRTRFIAVMMSLCLVVALGIVGIFAVQSLNMSVGGNISFTAEGLSIEVSEGQFKTEDGTAYNGITSQTGKLQGFTLDTNTKQSDVQSKIDSWSELELGLDSQGDAYLHFTIKNTMTDTLYVGFKKNLGSNTNNNMGITILPGNTEIASGVTTAFIITFDILDTSLNAGLTGFNIELTFSLEAQPKEPALLVSNDEFTPGCYLHSDTKQTTSAFGLLKSHDDFYLVQDIQISIEAADVSGYIVTFTLYDENKTRLGLTASNEPIPNGEITYTAQKFYGSFANAKYFRANIGLRSANNYIEIPATTQISIYATSTTLWAGKNITTVGDSITVGAGLDDAATQSYPYLLKDLTGANVTVNAQSGIKLVGGITSKVASMTAAADLIIIYGGTNDYWHGGVSIGELGTEDTTTYYGALKYILETLQTKYATSEYLFVFPSDQKFGSALSTADKGYGSLNDFRTAFLNFCTSNNIKHLDLGTTGFNHTLHTSDGVHPNAIGHQIIANAIFEYITSNY